MRVAITGAMGLIGRAVIEKLTCDDISLTCLSRREIPTSSARVRWLQGDLNEEGLAEMLVANQDVIIHLAHDSTPLSATSNLILDDQRSLFPTLKLIQAIAASKTNPHVIYLSSGGAIYGDGDRTKRPSLETNLCEPVMAYGIQKLTIERYLHSATRSGILRATILRVSNAYGTLLPQDRMQGLIGTSIARVIAGKSLRLIGNPNNIRDYVHISDIASAVKGTFQLTNDFEIINIGSGVGHSVADVLKLISKIGGVNTSIQIEEIGGSELLPSWCVLDINKAHRLLGWYIQTPLHEGISKMFEKYSDRL
jgi:UDP-glucose 4-epimerase